MAAEKLLDQTWYLPTYLVDDDGAATLLTHRYIVTRGSKRVRLESRIGAPRFRSSAVMADEIEMWGWRELPVEAEGQPQYVPAEVVEFVAAARASGGAQTVASTAPGGGGSR